MPDSLTGGCLCGAIRFTVGAPVADLRACHCTSCQKASGATGSVNAVVPLPAFKVTQGTPKRYEAKADSGRTLHRYFCADCGSPIYSQRATEHNNLVVVRAGLFDRKDGMRIKANIWTRSAAPWAHLDPETQQFPGQPA
jgi:hypothetical protein